MKLEEVTRLVEAGFTAAEIREMMSNGPENNPQNPQNNPQPVVIDEQKQNNPVPDNPDPVPDPDHSSDPVPDPGKQADPDDARFNQLNNTMERLIKTIQESNLRSGTFGNPTGTDLDTQVDNIMGSIIRPERQEGGKT